MGLDIYIDAHVVVRSDPARQQVLDVAGIRPVHEHAPIYVVLPIAHFDQPALDEWLDAMSADDGYLPVETLFELREEVTGVGKSPHFDRLSKKARRQIAEEVHPLVEYVIGLPDEPPFDLYYRSSR